MDQSVDTAKQSPVIENSPLVPPANLPSLPIVTTTKKSRLNCRCLGLVFLILLIVLSGLGAGGYFLWYLPRETKQFHAATAAQFQEIAELTDAIAPKINDIFGSTNPAENRYQTLNSEAAEYSQKIKVAQSGIPQSTQTTAELADSLKNYYAAADEFAVEYANSMNILDNTFVILMQVGKLFSNDKLTSANTTEDLRKVTESIRTEIVQLKETQSEISKIELATESLKEYQKVAVELTSKYLKTAEDILLSFDEIAAAVESKSQTRIETAINDLNRKVASSRQTNQTQTPADLKKKQEIIEAFFTDKLEKIQQLQAIVVANQKSLTNQLDSNPILQLIP
jgi:hypothetical protein